MANIEKRKKANTEVKTERMYIGLHDEFKKIAAIRFVNGLDKKPSPIRVQKKVLKHGLWGQIREDLKIANFLDDDRAQAFSIFTFMIFAFLVVVLFAGWIYTQGLIYDVFKDVGIQNEANSGRAGYVNMTAAADLTFGTIAESIKALRMVSFVYILCLGIVIIITNALIRIHPIWFFAYILICTLAIMFAAPIANGYLTLLQSNAFGGELQAFTVSNWILLHLPMVVFMVSIFGAVFLFINMVRSGNEDRHL